MRWIALAFGLLFALLPLPAPAAPVLLISIDGLRPGDLLEADKRGIQVPALHSLIASGAYATGVKGVLPTVTYPNHTTLITGVSPARHGIANNTVFDPLGKDLEGWYWYASDIKTPTLWSAVHAAHRPVASIGWPASVGARDIDDNIPEYWRAGDANDAKLLSALATPGLAAQLEEAAGVSLEALLSEEPEADAAKARYAVALIDAQHPQFMTLHLSSLDHWQHTFGPDTPKAHEALERIDADVGMIVAAARKAAPDAVVAIVSDHGFAPLDHDVNLKALFADHGLLTLDAAKRRITAWDAAPWPAGGSAAVVLARPNDTALRAKVAAVLADLQGRPDLGIAKVIGGNEIGARGATPLAGFFIDFKLGYEMGTNAAAPMVAPSTLKGMHGYFPDAREMRATFVISGTHLPRKGSLGDVDMRDIAPTLAGILGVALPGAEGKPLF